MKGLGGKILKICFYRDRWDVSLFGRSHETPGPGLLGIYKDVDWSFLRHPVRSFTRWRNAPRARPSLFNHLEAAHPVPFSWKEFFADFRTIFSRQVFVSSVFSESEDDEWERAQKRTRKMEAGMLSLFIHAMVLGLIMLSVGGNEKQVPLEENVVFIAPPMHLPFEGDGRDGGGGGGGGMGEPGPPATGEMPEIAPTQMTVPALDRPIPLLPAEDLMVQTAMVRMPIDIPRNLSMPIGDITAPPNFSTSSGPGIGGGIGTGRGTGVGSGTGPGVGPGSGGGMGGGSGGGIGSGVGPYVAGSGVRPPVAISKPEPLYTEEARKERIQGIVLLQGIVRKDGSIDSFKVLRGLGYGLDESAINMIATRWRFQPGTKNGVPVDVQINIEISFRMH
ncbi:MAG TPA: energy transducer TonB [Acidobacteriota bacterium]|nr:energy transducer TonB [Acidobacteriota bacterium]